MEMELIFFAVSLRWCEWLSTNDKRAVPIKNVSFDVDACEEDNQSLKATLC